MNKKGAISFQDTFYNFMFLALCVLALFSFIFVLQRDNNAPQPISNNTLFSETATNLGSTLNNSESSSKIQQNIFNAEKPQQGFGSIVLFGIVSAGKTFTNMIYSFFDLILRIPMVVLGIDSKIVSAFITILVVTLIIGIWIVYKLGG